MYVICNILLALVFNTSPATGSQSAIVRRMRMVKARHLALQHQLAVDYPDLTHLVNSSCTERYSLMGGSIPSVDTCNSLGALHQITRSLQQVTKSPYTASVKQQAKAFNTDILQLVRSYTHYMSSQCLVVCPQSDDTGGEGVEPRTWRHEFEYNYKLQADAKFQMCKLSKNAQFYLYPSYSTSISSDFQQWCYFVQKC